MKPAAACPSRPPCAAERDRHGDPAPARPPRPDPRPRPAAITPRRAAGHAEVGARHLGMATAVAAAYEAGDGHAHSTARRD
ncbi:hypothetical protein [Burkholderia gladioli]|uniref:hypothetical protein n=1 Tax=Burkholderia gladioli TaxID=28095 RepID=UPI00163E1258|nr:hypothetical protein [Burkholderia gladioli]